ncbi:hypothetical protein NCCP2716_24390 [Sporosarcina sp. NCCP-2716]|nr:hypothetical protein NCCP2716_24390 [Sporosarcina sp. NCCP-2716]
MVDEPSLPEASDGLSSITHLPAETVFVVWQSVRNTVLDAASGSELCLFAD